MDIIDIVLSKKYTDESLKGITGTLAGKNCTIKSATKADGVTTVVFAWTADDGTEKTTTIQGNDGAKGEIGDKGDKGDKLTFNDLTDEEKVSLKGADGVSPIITENINNTDDIYRLAITTDTGTIITPNLKGGGSGGSDKFTRDDLTAVTVGGLNSGSSVKNKTTKEVLESILVP